MNQTLVLGVGNYLLSDDGVSVHVIERMLAAHEFPPDVQVVDGGTCGLDLLQYLEGVNNLILIDAIHASQEAGSIIRLSGDQVPAYLALKISPHDIGLPDLLATAKLRDLYPENVVVIGIQPASLEFGVELSTIVANRLDELAETILAETRLMIAAV